QKIGLVPEDAFLLARLLQQHAADKQTQSRAMALMKALTKVQPDYARYWSFYGGLLVNNKDYAGAAEAAKQVERIEELRKVTAGMYGSIELKARCLELQGKGPEAVALLEAFVRQPNAPPARGFQLAALHGRLGEFAKAVELCDTIGKAGMRDEAFGAV